MVIGAIVRVGAREAKTGKSETEMLLKAPRHGAKASDVRSGTRVLEKAKSFDCDANPKSLNDRPGTSYLQ